MRRWVAATVLAVLSVVGMPAVAHADEADCAGNGYTEGSYEYFEPDRRFVPPPLRGATPWDCAIRAGDAVFDETLDSQGGYIRSVQYLLLYVDLTFDELVTVFRALEDAGYMEPGDINIVDNGGDVTSTTELDAQGLAALDPEPTFVNARFSNPLDVPPPSTPGSNIYEFRWSDGEVSPPTADIRGRPTLLVNVILTEPFGSATGLGDPSTLSGLPTIQDKIPTPGQWAVIGAGSVMLMLVVGWPSALLNSVVGSRYQALVHAVTTRFRRRPAESASDTDTAIRRSGLPGWLMWPGFALAAILGAFVDPDFGWNPMSLRLVVTLFLSFLLFNLAAWGIVRRVATRLQPDSQPYLRFRWGSLLLVIVAVVVARLLGLEPGVIFGLVAGIAYATTLQAARSAIVTIVGSAFGLALALVAWVAYSLLAPVPIENFAYVFLVEFLAGVTVKGVSTLPLSLLPLGNLDGAKLFGWRKVAWGASYAVGLAAFMLVLLTIPKAWGEIPGDFVRWLVLFGAYAIVAVVVWAVNARMLKRKPLPPEKEQGDQPDAITID